MNTAPFFSEAQKEAILRATGKKTAMTIARYENTIEKDELAGAGDAPVYGAFVSLKRFRQPRACCGFTGENVPLFQALDRAAHRAAVDDLRFPAIENHEINELEMEVWVLFSPELIGAHGENRKNFVETGKHGLLVVQGERRGLLLPGVATEMKLSPEAFLEQTCEKACLPRQAWKEEKTLVFRFQGMVFSGALRDFVPEELTSQILVEPKGPTRNDVARLADHCYRNIGKQYESMIPDPYLLGAFDGNVNGACLRVRLKSISADCAQIHLNRPQPLQATLLELSRNAALAMRQQNLKPAELQKTALCVFWDAQSLGNGETADVSAVDTRHSGILAVRFGKWILGYAPGRKPEQILEDILKSSGFERDEETQIFSAFTVCTDVAFMTSTVQKPTVRSTPRPPAVAGLFYPAQPDVMERGLDGFFTPGGVEKQDFAGALIPHGGWRYSGQLVARTLEQTRLANRILIFAPKHHALGVDWGVCPASRWNLPGRPMEGDESMSRALVEAVPRFKLDSLAHEREHSIEVVLPFLSRLAPGAHVVGAVMQGGNRFLAESAKQLAEWIASLPQRPSLIASSDLNHYASQDDTLRVDQLVVEALRALDPEEMLNIVRENRISMCGAIPCAFMMMTLRELGLLNRCATVGHATSADAGGETKSVVGYCGMLFC